MAFWFYLLFIFAATLLGGVLPLKFAGSKRVISLSVAFAAGVLVGTALFHILPESIGILGASTGWPLLIGFAIFYLPQKFILTHPCEEEDCDFHTLGVLAFIGIAFHAGIDGVGVGAAPVLPSIGPMITTAVAVHKFPAALALSSMLIVSGMNKKTVMTLIILFAFVTPLGAVITDGFLESAEPLWLGYALGLSAGNFLGIAGSDLLRKIHLPQQTDRLYGILLLILGLSISLIGTEIPLTGTHN